jgi:parallel beta-helix repeat protein
MVFRPFTFAALVAAALPMLVGAEALGQTMIISDPQGPAPQREQLQEYVLIHVNAGSGNDASGDGSQLRPFQTISHALDVAEPNTVILLAPGEYSADSGENFPLRLRSGVTVQGAVGTSLGSTLIRGNGTLVAANGNYLQVAIVGVDGAGLANVTVTNPSSSGYGLVVEAGRPIIRFNGFLGSGYAGAYVGGSAEPLFEQNVFSENGSVGLLLADQSRAEVVGNVFQNTGIGIQIAPGAEPRITQNRIVSNRQGIVMAANAQPQLQDNEIAGNRQNGLIEFTTATKAAAATEIPTMTNAPSNAPHPLAAQSGLISASPVTLATVGGNGFAPRSLQASPHSGPETSLPSPPVVHTAGLDAARPDAAESDAVAPRANGTTAIVSPSSDLTAASPDQPQVNIPTEENAGVAEVVVAPASVENIQTTDSRVAQPTAALPTAVAPSVPAEASAMDEEEPAHTVSRSAPQESIPQSGLLRVPDGNIPAGRGASQVPVLTASREANATNLTADAPPPPPSRASMLGLVYRVVVAVTDSSNQSEIRALVPDAFRVEVEGQMMMQVGAYPTESEATAMLEELQQQGMEAQILHIP